MSKKVRLMELAWLRSGDKGDKSNIGVMAKGDKEYELVKMTVTAEAIKAHFKDWVKGAIEVYPMDNLQSLELVLNNGLGGGATRTLRFDQTGKSMGQALGYMEVDVPDDFVSKGV
jgi:hypothetical protein